MTPNDQPDGPPLAPLTDPLTAPDVPALPPEADPLLPVDATQQDATDEQVKAATGPWSIKPQEVTDRHSGLTLTFGNHADDSNTVFLILSHNGLGSLITFHRNGDVLKCQPLTTQTDAQKAALAKAQEAENPKLHTPEPADTDGSAAVLGERHRPEPWRDNKLAPLGVNVDPNAPLAATGGSGTA
jgi:hypothetical protein